jgi:UV DNA damage endonuclease
LFRISSDLIPFGSSAAMDLAWPEHFAADLERIGEKIRSSGLRVSMHPGQYTVINSPDPEVARRAALDLEYHNLPLDSLRLGPEHKIILHLGGVYGDKDTAKERFIKRWQDLSPAIRSRLVIENDDRLFTIRDVFDVSSRTGIPVVYDNLHNAINPADTSRPDLDWINLAADTWQPADGRQKIHYSQQDPDKRPGAHSSTIAVLPFLDFYEKLPDIDIMLEVKDKNLSALKCINCISNRGISALEAEWGRYKYSVLEHAPAAYQAVRQLLKDKRSYPAIEMYLLIEIALAKEVQLGSAVTAAQHVWGYFCKQASPAEKSRWETALKKYIDGAASLGSVKSVLQKLAFKYDEDYLNYSYYFEL